MKYRAAELQEVKVFRNDANAMGNNFAICSNIFVFSFLLFYITHQSSSIARLFRRLRCVFYTATASRVTLACICNAFGAKCTRPIPRIICLIRTGRGEGVALDARWEADSRV